MSTTDLGRYDSRIRPREIAAREVGALDVVKQFLAPWASLRLTVALLGLSLVLVLAGTVAQIDKDVWFVVNEYFRTWIAWIQLRIFFPRSLGISEAVSIPFPGGKLLGVLLAINLLAAHAVRFKVAAHGSRLWAGWALIAIAVAMTYGVVASGSNATVESELSAAFTNGLWHAVRALVGAAALTLAYVLALTRVRAQQSAARWLWWFGAAVAAILAALAGWLFTHPEARLDASGLRILWQLAKALGASAVLTAGCWLVFAKRAGIVVLHSGIALLMFGELYTSEQAVEAQMRIAEGETATYAEDMRSAELAFIDISDPMSDETTVVPAWKLREAFRTGEPIVHQDLPLTVYVRKYVPNATTRLVQPGETPMVAAGLGQLRTLNELPTSTGVETNQAFDVPAVIVELREKDGEKKSRGEFLLSPFLPSEPLTADGTAYEAALRFKRVPKPYAVSLVKFKFDRYEGTEIAKNFESVVRFRVPEQNIDRTVPVYMNNPLRYAGDTLYQADWDKETEQGTVLQVVTNAGWMIPYVACVIVAVGMLVHFVQAIVRFVSRREDEARRQQAVGAGGGTAAGGLAGATPTPWSSPRKWIPALIVVVFAAFVARAAARPAPPGIRRTAGGLRRTNSAHGHAGSQCLADGLGQIHLRRHAKRQAATRRPVVARRCVVQAGRVGLQSRARRESRRVANPGPQTAQGLPLQPGRIVRNGESRRRERTAAAGEAGQRRASEKSRPDAAEIPGSVLEGKPDFWLAGGVRCAGPWADAAGIFGARRRPRSDDC
jgi:hypothetical protein